MSHDALTNDLQLAAGDLRTLESPDEIAHFFARLGYDVDGRIRIPSPAALGLVNEEYSHTINRIEQIGVDPVDGDIVIYLFEVRSVTARLRNDIARRFRERPENALLVLTKDYAELEFVLLDRALAPSKKPGTPLRQTVRPIPLAFERTNASAVALRAIKRFTFTEADATYQWDKLRSAFALAEWSEPYFNNRALFSDHYLNHRLPDTQITPEWAEDVRPIGRFVFERLATARRTYSRANEQVIRAGLYEPLFKQLGFAFTAQKPGESAAEQADYLLFDPAKPDTPVAAALTYVWNRNLDDADEARDTETPAEIPGALVVSLLQAQVAPWVIVTNGKLWRVYSATASNKATNYYEVDLEEAAAAEDQITALKYWWLLFRRPAFTGFLDKLLKESAEYAKGLGERLKERVFTQIFPQFAKGFVSGGGGGIYSAATADLDAVFTGTLTFLYRLMFVLYAESLDLLPVNEPNGYRELSLRQLKGEVADAAGTLLDQSGGKLAAKYTPSSTALYERLMRLFDAIDRGADELNMPAYNGGLFSAATPEGQFLATHSIPDRFLALGLDRLARDVDERSKGLVFIDFKSLGVRQLGSIYEGLLEFKLRVASEKLAVTKEKGREIYGPFAKAKKPLATISKGDVYLENDKRERKATGSYYTPDYIVKYIVQHTVGPVLDRAFDDLRPRLHAAQKGFRDYAKLVKARGTRGNGGIYPAAPAATGNPTTFWNEPAMQHLVDDCLNIRVLDPAMGSGHFLVEVVDYISNRVIDFLNAWSDNPVWAALERTRADIVAEMERQHVTIDAERLTRVALLKRAVLKRCVYGVDLNSMAVELAKVSLWLDAFTLGAPLSFLDHHLKWGNSLIGARIADVQTYLDTGATNTMDMFASSKFAGVMLATDLMRQVSYLSDNTVEQSRQSAAAYRDASDHLAPFKRLLDVYVSRWFGNAPAKKNQSDYVRLFLQDPDTEAWLNDPAAPLDNSLIPATQIAATATRAAAEKRFFHWELEFPEVFFAPSTPGGQDVQLREGGGFDAVVGNPPYSFGRDWGQISEKDFLTNKFSVAEYQLDLYQLFMQILFDSLALKGLIGFIVPDTWTQSVYALALRELVLSKTSVNRLIALNSGVFPDATVDTLIFVIEKNTPSVEHNIDIFHQEDNFLIQPSPSYLLKQSLFLNEPSMRINFLTSPQVRLLNQKITSNIFTVDDMFETTRGINAYDKARGQSLDIISSRAYHSSYKKSEKFKPELMGSDIGRYEISWNGDHWIKYGSWLAAPREPRFFSQVKLMARKILSNGRIVSVVDKDSYYVDQQIYIGILRPNQDHKISLYYVTAILNSSATNFVYTSRYREKDVVFPQMTVEAFTQLPIRRIDFTTPAAERAARVEEAIAAYAGGDSGGALALARAAIDAGKTDVVHDLLAHLAEQMIALNKTKQAEVKRFLGWVEEVLGIAEGIDSLTGKSILQNYLGDYQKGQPETPWAEFHYRLFQNRRRFGVALAEIEGQIESEYERSLATLVPIKRDLARTDALIDKIVYRLYGLTDDEIELIERPQYEQALADAKAQVVANDEIKDDDARIDKIAESILPAAQRFFDRVEPKTDEEMLDAELPGWNTLPPQAPTFLLTGDYNLRTLPAHMDFSTAVIPYTKAVEVALYQRIFIPFRDESGNTDADVRNDFLKKFMRRQKELTLGAFAIIFQATEPALRAFVDSRIPNAATAFYGDNGVVAMLNDTRMVAFRNDAAHDEVLARDDAAQIRAWALGVLRRL